MPYVKRDEAGQIVSVSLSREDDDQEFLDAESAQLAAFFEDARASADSLRESDTDLVRVLEDLIEMLTAKGIILFTELPESAQQKILLRKRLRKDRTNSLDSIGRGLKQPLPFNPFLARRHSWCLPPASQTAWWWAHARARYATRPWG